MCGIFLGTRPLTTGSSNVFDTSSKSWRHPGPDDAAAPAKMQTRIADDGPNMNQAVDKTRVIRSGISQWGEGWFTDNWTPWQGRIHWPWGYRLGSLGLEGQVALSAVLAVGVLCHEHGRAALAALLAQTGDLSGRVYLVVLEDG